MGAPVAAEIGAADWLRLPEQNAAERQIARFAEGADLAAIYGDLVVRSPAASPPDPRRSACRPRSARAAGSGRGPPQLVLA